MIPLLRIGFELYKYSAITYWLVVVIVLCWIVSLFINSIKIKKIINKKVLISIIILLFLSSIRFWDLDAMPMNEDELRSFFWPAEYMKDNRFSQNPYMVNYAYIPINDFSGTGTALFTYLTFLNLHIINDPILAIRSISVLVGIITVLLTFFLIKSLYSYKIGLLSSLFLALLPWHVIHSRIGISEILVPLFGVLIFYTFKKTIEKKDIKFLFLMSMLLGIGVSYIYTSSKLFLIITLFLVIIYYKRLSRYGFKNIILTIFIFLLFLYPHLALAYTSDYEFNGRIKAVIQQEFSLDKYIENLEVEFRMLFQDVHGKFMYGQSLKGPLLSSTLGILLIFAFASTIFKKKADTVVNIWLVVPLLFVPIAQNVVARYLLAILPIFLVIISKFLNDIIESTSIKNSPYKKLIYFITLLIIGITVLNLSYLNINYFQNVKKDLNENIIWGYGIEQAIEFLFEEKIKNDNFIILGDWRMVPGKYYTWRDYGFLKGEYVSLSDVDTHFIPDFPKDGERIKDFGKNYLKKGITSYYLIWNPAMRYGDCLGLEEKRCQYIRWGADIFNKIHPDKKPIQTIYYPNKEIALNIYEIKI